MSGANHLKIQVLPAVQYNWVEADVSVRAESFSGQFRAHYALNDFVHLRGGLAQMYKRSSGTFVFEPLDGQILLQFVRSKSGQISVNCWAEDRPNETSCEIRWQIEMDQSYIPAILRDLDEITEVCS